MKKQLLIIITIISLSSASMAETIQVYKNNIQTIMHQTQKESLITKRNRINDLGKRIESDIRKSTYPNTELENNELSWKVELSTGIQLMELTTISKEKCEKIRISLLSKLNSPTIETETNFQINNDRPKMTQDLLEDLLEYMCYE